MSISTQNVKSEVCDAGRSLFCWGTGSQPKAHNRRQIGNLAVSIGTLILMAPMVMALPESTDLNVNLDGLHQPLIVGQIYQVTIVLIEGEQPAPGRSLTLRIKGDVVQFESQEQELGLETNPEGSAIFKCTALKKGTAHIAVHIDNVTVKTVEVVVAEAYRLNVSVPNLILPKTHISDGLVVNLSHGDSSQSVFNADGVSIRAEVKLGGLRLGDDGSMHTTLEHSLSDGNTSSAFSLITSKEFGDGVVYISASRDDKLVGETFVPYEVDEGYRDSIFSKRTAVDLLLGSTFNTQYAADGSSEGFSDATPVAQLAFDTLWFLGREKKHRWHTGLEMTLGSFPTVTTDPEPTGDVTKEDSKMFLDYADSFSGDIRLVKEIGPSYKTGESHDTELPNDAINWSFNATAGFITRDQQSASGDTAVGRYSAGFGFSNHHTEATSAEFDVVNRRPIRFFRANVAYYEEYPSGILEGEPFNRQGAWRGVIDAGMRIKGIGNKTIPFYTGIHANVGQGSDDVRIFAGLLFKIDQIPRLFQ